MKSIVQEIGAAMGDLLRSPSERLLVVFCDPEDSALFLKSLESLEDDPDNPDIFLTLAHPFRCIEDYMESSIAEIRRGLAEVNDVRAQRGETPLSGLPEEAISASLNPLRRLSSAFKQVRRLVEPERQVVWTLAPVEIDNPSGYLRMVDFLHGQLADRSFSGTKIIVRDSGRSPVLGPHFETDPAVRLYHAGLDPASLEKKLAEHANDPRTPLEEQTQLHMMLAGYDVARGGFEQAMSRNLELLGYSANNGGRVHESILLNNFLTGSPNALLGDLTNLSSHGVPRGFGKLLKPLARTSQLRLPENGRLKNSLCEVVGRGVDSASGRVFISHRDFRLAGRIPIAFERAYDTSAVDYTGSLGPGWTHPFDVHLWVDDAQDMIILRNEEARQVGFARIAVGEKAFHPIEKQSIERLEENVYLVRDVDGRRRRFEPLEGSAPGRDIGSSEAQAFRLTAVLDRNENQLRLLYKEGLLDAIEDGVGRRIVFSYLTLDDGSVRLASVAHPLDQTGSRTSRLVGYSYDAEGRLASAVDRGRISRRYVYEQRLLTSESNCNGLCFYFTYEGEGTAARCTHTWGDRGIYERRLRYNPEEKRTVVENSRGNQTVLNFNPLDQPLSIVNPLGGARRFEYGINGELLSETDEIGRMTAYRYDDAANCIETIYADGATRRFAYTPESLLQSLIDESGAETRQEYDARGNLIAAIDALGARWEYGYNDQGDLIEALDPMGGAIRYKRNEQGWVIARRSAGGLATQFEYDEQGRLLSISDPAGNTTHYDYDPLDRLVQVRFPDHSKRQYEYDPEGNLIRFRNANGFETRYQYADDNQLSERIDALNYKRRFSYDAEGNLVEARNERGEAYRFVYDALDRLTLEVGFDGLAHRFEYDAAGQLERRTDPAGRITHFVRDPRGRTLERQRSDGSVIRFEYDPTGRIAQAVAPGSEVRFRYDAVGRKLTKSQNGQTIEFEYDALGRRTLRRSPQGHTVQFMYDTDSRLRTLQTPHGAMEFDSDAAGRVSRRRTPGGLEESFHYDPCGRLIEQSLSGKQTLLFLRSYRYDDEGNLTELRDSNRGVSRYVYDAVERLSEVSVPERGLERFFYDGTGNLLRRGERNFRYGAPDRLTETEEATFIYDDAGNLVEKREGDSVFRYTYDPDNQLVAVESDASGRVQFAYDALGRRITKETENGDVRFLWDGERLLAELSEPKSYEYVFLEKGMGPICRFDGDRCETYHHDHLGTAREMSDDQGAVIWAARYDVHGECQVDEESQVRNAMRFRGGYEDPETGLAYHRGRYFDPTRGGYLTQDRNRLLGGGTFYSGDSGLSKVRPICSKATDKQAANYQLLHDYVVWYANR